MSLYVPDPWQAMPLGPGTPPGWTDIFTTSTDVRSFADRGAFFPHQWYQLNTNQQNSPQFVATAVASLTIWFAYSPINPGPIIDMLGTSNLGNQFEVCRLQQENDGTLSAYVAGLSSPIFNTGLFARAYGATFCPGTQIGENWYYIQWNIQITTTGIGGINFLTLNTDLAVDGEVLFTNQSGISNFFTDTSFQHLGVNQLALRNVSGFGELNVADKVAAPTYPRGVWTVALTSGGNGLYKASTTVVTITDGTTGIGATAVAVIPVSPGPITNLLLTSGGLNYTAPIVTIVDTSGSGSGATAIATLAPTPFRRIFQAVNEVIESPTTSNVQVYQGVVEVIKNITTPNVRIYQGVIELIMQRQVIPGGWQVYEA